MANIKEKRFLKRHSGISLEVLTKKLNEYRIPYSLEIQKETEKYFRDTIVKVKKSLIDLFNDYNIISNVQLRQFNEEENCIELNATYNFLIIPDNINFKIDENYVELTPEYAKKLDSSAPVSRPIDRIRIYQS